MSNDETMLTLHQVAERLNQSIQLVRRWMDDDDSFPLPERVCLLNPQRAKGNGGPGHAYLWRPDEVARYGALKGQNADGN